LVTPSSKGHRSDLFGILGVGFAHRRVRILRRVRRLFDGRRGRLRRCPQIVADGQAGFELLFDEHATLIQEPQHSVKRSLAGSLRQLFQHLSRGPFAIFFPRRFRHPRFIHLLFDASQGRLVGFFLRLAFVLGHTWHDVTGPNALPINSIHNLAIFGNYFPGQRTERFCIAIPIRNL